MDFSIIVAIYNIESYIDECVSSVINQDYTDFELLLVNDGSTDNSLAVLKKWENIDKRIRVINKPNGGLSSARNAGLACAKGKYIVYIDGDDWITPDLLSSVANYIKAEGDADMICFDYWCYFDSQNMKYDSYDSTVNSTAGLTFFAKSKFKLTAWSKVYRKEYLDKVNIQFLEGRLHEDISYTVPLCVCAIKVGWIKKPLYYYRQNRKDSIMSKVTYRNVLDFSHAICFNYYFFKERNMLNPIIVGWVMRCFYKACFTGQTDYKTLKRAFVENNVLKIAEELGDAKWFWTKLFFYHFYMKARTIMGVVKRLVF